MDTECGNQGKDTFQSAMAAEMIPVAKSRKRRRAQDMSMDNFYTHFPDDDAAMKFLEWNRWHGEPTCPHCNAPTERVHRLRKNGVETGLFQCNGCRKKFNAMTGTVMQGTRLSVRKWLQAIYLTIVSRSGISSVQLGAQLGIRQQSAWRLLMRIRKGMEEDWGRKLQGIVEIDAMYVGGVEKNKHADKKLHQGRGAVGKICVLGLHERDGDMRAFIVAGETRETCESILLENVEPGTMVQSDDTAATANIERLGYRRLTVNHSEGEYAYRTRDGQLVTTNTMESDWSLATLMIRGTIIKVSRKHLQSYLNEISFRRNRAPVDRKMIDVMSDILTGFIGKRLTYREFTGKTALDAALRETAKSFG